MAQAEVRLSLNAEPFITAVRKLTAALRELKEIMVKTPPTEALARKAYDAYGKVTDYKNYQGLPMPLFDDLGEKIQEAWCAAVDSVVRSVVVVVDDDELDPDL